MLEAAKLTLLVDAGANADAEELDDTTRQLLAELHEQNVESVELQEGGPAPEGTKGGEAERLGALAVSVLPDAVEPLVGFLKDWAARGQGRNRSVKIKVERGDTKMELEYDPATMTPEQLRALMLALSPQAAGNVTRGGVTLNNQGSLSVGGDMAGRDNIQVHAEAGATVIINPPPEKTE